MLLRASPTFDAQFSPISSLFNIIFCKSWGILKLSIFKENYKKVKVTHLHTSSIFVIIIVFPKWNYLILDFGIGQRRKNHMVHTRLMDYQLIYFWQRLKSENEQRIWSNLNFCVKRISFYVYLIWRYKT